MFWFTSTAKTHAVASNLRAYVTEATLPPLKLSPQAPNLPLEGHKSHKNRLTIRPERYRKLRGMTILDDNNLVPAIRQFTQKYIPFEPVKMQDEDPDSGMKPLLPAEGFDVPRTTSHPIRHVEDLGASWILVLVLGTMERLFQMIPEFQHMSDWSFNRPDTHADLDHSIFRYFLWEREKIKGNLIPVEETRSCNMVFAYQPPWILSQQDLLEFVNTDFLPMYTADQGVTKNRFNGSQRVWAKLWDICRVKKSRIFVLTNYSQWVFGGFSRGWTHGFVSTIKSLDSSNPSVLQFLLYWTCMSLDPNKLSVIPEVFETYVDEDLSSIQLMNQTPLADLEYEPSESQWDSRSVSTDCRTDYSTSSSIADKRELLRLSPEPVNPDGIWNVDPGSREKRKRLLEKIEGWSGRKVQRVEGQVGVTRERSPSPASSVSSDWSVDTVKQEYVDVKDGFHGVSHSSYATSVNVVEYSF